MAKTPRIERSEGLLHSIKTSAMLCTIGAALTLLALFIHEHFCISNILLDLLEKIGEAFIVVALVDVVIHLPDWKEYFYGGIRRAIMEDEYLARLDDDSLKNLIARALKVRLKVSDVSLTTRGGFIDYLFSDIQKFIAEPYREDVREVITCSVKDDTFFEIEDDLSYTCRASTEGKLQDSVKWQNDPNEIAEMIKITISVVSQQGEETLYTGGKEAVARDFPDNMINKVIPPDKKQDGLFITIKATYLVRRDVFQYWTMSHLTKNLWLVLKYPKGYSVRKALFGIDTDLAVPIPKDGPGETSCEIIYRQWILPSNGIAWKFYETGATGGLDPGPVTA